MSNLVEYQPGSPMGLALDDLLPVAALHEGEGITVRRRNSRGYSPSLGGPRR